MTVHHSGLDGRLDPTATPSSELLDRLRTNIASVVLGKPDAIRMALVALLAEGHLLIEDVPGVGKTLLAKALAKSVTCTFHRIQFTPDLLPSDLLGTSVLHQATGQFVFQPGPVFANIILADEINRATPRTQSALLEAMSDRQISLDGQTRPLGPPFLVLATQNPYEFEGTYPLPESQLDRFLIRVRLGYPDRVAERRILRATASASPSIKCSPCYRRWKCWRCNRQLGRSASRRAWVIICSTSLRPPDRAARFGSAPARERLSASTGPLRRWP